LSPIFDLEMIETARARGLDIIPSISTPNELHNALRAYDGPIAVLPAQGLGGPDYLGRLHAAFPDARLLAFGGVGSDTAPQYLEQGATAVVVDTGLFPTAMDPESHAI